jgi:hypothetical protein
MTLLKAGRFDIIVCSYPESAILLENWSELGMNRLFRKLPSCVSHEVEHAFQLHPADCELCLDVARRYALRSPFPIRLTNLLLLKV